MFNRQRNTPDDNVDPGKAVEAKFTSLEEKVTKLAESAVTKSDLEALTSSLKTLTEREAEKERKAREAEEARLAREREQRVYNPDEAFNEFASDPRKVLNSAVAPAAKAAALALSRQERANVLEGKEYYHGNFKKKVDQLIENGTNDFNQMSNPSYILNCYNVVLGEVVSEGKLDEYKRTASMHGFSDGSTGGAPRDPNAKPSVEFRDTPTHSASKTRYAAQQLGLKDEDIIEAAKQGVIHGLEVIA